MGFETELTRKTRDYVDQFLRENMKEPLPYHNFNHLEDVVHASIEIGQAMKLIEDQLEMVVIASWFHDIGYYKGWEDHELTGREIAGKFLRSQGVSEKKIEEVGGCILATRLPQRPTNILEKVVCDADLHHISSEEFFDKSELLRR